MVRNFNFPGTVSSIIAPFGMILSYTWEHGSKGGEISNSRDRRNLQVAAVRVWQFWGVIPSRQPPILLAGITLLFCQFRRFGQNEAAGLCLWRSIIKNLPNSQSWATH